MEYQLQPIKSGLNGILFPPADKSISHRSVILASLASGTTKISNFLISEDSLSTLKIVEQLGVKSQLNGQTLTITSPGFHNLKASDKQLKANNSGTTMRLMLGVLSGISGKHFLTGDNSLQKRPMKRVVSPLRKMNAKIQMTNDNFAPLTILGNKLQKINCTLQVPSAQVKSALILAALFASGTSRITEPIISRNHTEQMIPLFDGKIMKDGQTWIIPGNQKLKGTNLKIPGDFSSAAFFIVAGLITPNSYIILKNVNLNPTRTGLLKVLKQMQADIKVSYQAFEEGEIVIKTSNLIGTTVNGAIIPTLIDELPLIALLATQARGTTIIQDAKELRYKETDRIQTIATTLKQMGANILETDDGLIIEGPTKLKGGIFSSFNDHRIGMMIAIASQIATGKTILKDIEAINISYPNFINDLNSLKEGI